MQKNNQSFLRALINFLKSKVKSQTTFSNLVLLDIDSSVIKEHGTVFKHEFNDA